MDYNKFKNKFQNWEYDHRLNNINKWLSYKIGKSIN